jgi:hypothetical protein
MHRSSRLAVFCFSAVALLADGGSGGTKQVSLHIPNEMAPPGGLVQMKFLVTEPTPISSGKPIVSFDAAMFDDVWGIELFNPTGDVNGVALLNGSQLGIRYVTSSGAQGTDYPIMTIALHVRPDAAVGSQTLFTLDPTSTWDLGLLGTVSYKPTPPATITVGGSISITNVVPGGGFLPVGTVVSIRGLGFQPKTQVQLNSIKGSAIHVVSPQEIQFTIAEATNMTGKKIQVVNPDGSQDTYFSYLRGIPLAKSARPLLSGAIPIFSSLAYSQAVFAPMSAGTAQFTGLAMQNPSLEAANVRVSLYSATNDLLGSAAISLPSGYRLMQETSELAGGATPMFGSYVVVRSSQPIQIFGFAGDEAAGWVSPFTPVAAKP